MMDKITCLKTMLKNESYGCIGDHYISCTECYFFEHLAYANSVNSCTFPEINPSQQPNKEIVQKLLRHELREEKLKRILT